MMHRWVQWTRPPGVLNFWPVSYCRAKGRTILNTILTTRPCLLQLRHMWAAGQLLWPFWSCGAISAGLQPTCLYVSFQHIYGQSEKLCSQSLLHIPDSYLPAYTYAQEAVVG